MCLITNLKKKERKRKLRQDDFINTLKVIFVSRETSVFHIGQNVTIENGIEQLKK